MIQQRLLLQNAVSHHCRCKIYNNSYYCYYYTGEDSDIPVIGNSSGFVSVPTNGMLVIGESACVQAGEGVMSIVCPLSSGSNESDTFKYSWRKDGQILEDETNSIIAITEHGEYSCTASNKCGEDMGTSQIYGML